MAMLAEECKVFGFLSHSGLKVQYPPPKGFGPPRLWWHKVVPCSSPSPPPPHLPPCHGHSEDCDMHGCWGDNRPARYKGWLWVPTASRTAGKVPAPPPSPPAHAGELVPHLPGREGRVLGGKGSGRAPSKDTWSPLLPPSCLQHTASLLQACWIFALERGRPTQDLC